MVRSTPDKPQARVQVVANEIDGRQELAQALQGVVLTLNWDENAVRGRQGVHGQQADCRRAIEQDEVEFAPDLSQMPAGDVARAGRPR